MSATAAVLALTALLAHGPWHERIAALDEAIAASPGEATLYFQRGELHRQDGGFEAAEADYQEALRRDPALARVHVGRSQAFRARGDLETARRAVLEGLSLAPRDGILRLECARVETLLEHFEEAESHFDFVLAHEERPAPGVVLEAAEVAARVGGPKAALERLDRGMARLGPIVALQLPAVEHARALGDPQDAVKRVLTVEATVPRKERWQVLRAEIWREAGDWAAVRAALAEARASFASLSPARKANRAVQELLHRFEQLEQECRDHEGPSGSGGDAGTSEAGETSGSEHRPTPR